MLVKTCIAPLLIDMALRMMLTTAFGMTEESEMLPSMAIGHGKSILEVRLAPALGSFYEGAKMEGGAYRHLPGNLVAYFKGRSRYRIQMYRRPT